MQWTRLLMQSTIHLVFEVFVVSIKMMLKFENKKLTFSLVGIFRW